MPCKCVGRIVAGRYLPVKRSGPDVRWRNFSLRQHETRWRWNDLRLYLETPNSEDRPMLLALAKRLGACEEE